MLALLNLCYKMTCMHFCCLFVCFTPVKKTVFCPDGTDFVETIAFTFKVLIFQDK